MNGDNRIGQSPVNVPQPGVGTPPEDAQVGTSKGQTVEKQSPDVQISKAAARKESSEGADISITDRKAEKPGTYNADVEVDADEGDVFLATVEDQSELSHVSEKTIEECKRQVLEGGMERSEAKQLVEGLMEKRSTFKGRVSLAWQNIKTSMTSKLETLFSKLHLDRNTAADVTDAAADLIDFHTNNQPEGNLEAVASEVVTQIASNVENEPAQMLGMLEDAGLDKQVAKLKSSFQVASNKNLPKIKNALIKGGDSIPAFQGLNDDERDVLVNGALIACKLANPDGMDASEISGRNYIIGRVPGLKWQILELILNQSPEKAVDMLSGQERLAGTNFKTKMERYQFGGRAGEQLASERKQKNEERIESVQQGTDLDELDGISTMFEDAEKDAHQVDVVKLNAELKVLNEELSLLTSPQLQMQSRLNYVKVKGLGALQDRRQLSGEIKQKAGEFRKRRETAELEASNLKAEEDKRQAEEELRNKYETAKQAVIDGGGLTWAQKPLEKLSASLVTKLEAQHNAEKAKLLADAILVQQELAAYGEPDSSGSIVLTAHSSKFDAALTNADSMADMREDQLMSLLMSNPVVNDAGLQEAIDLASDASSTTDQ